MPAGRHPILILPILLLAATAGCGGGGSRGDGSSSPAITPSPSATLNTSPPISTPQEAIQHAAWTVLIYLDADNDLEVSGIANFNQMEMIGSTRDVRVIVQIDRAPGFDSSNGDWTDTRRYLVTRDSDTKAVQSLRLDDPPLGELNMGAWQTLRDFVEWGTREFPADHYCLVIWDHGTGWQPRIGAVPKYKYIASDDTSGSGVDVTDLPKALVGLNLDVIAFDACLMQQIEVAYELRDCAHYVVGSPGPVPAAGYDYQAWIKRICADTTPVQLCREIVSEYAFTYPEPARNITQSAIDLSRVPELASAVDSFARTLRQSASSPVGLRSAHDLAFNYSTSDGGTQRYCIDLMHYASMCDATIPEAHGPYATLSNAYSTAMVAEMHNPDNPSAHGVAIYLPPPTAYDARYGTLDLATDTQWDEWIRGHL